MWNITPQKIACNNPRYLHNIKYNIGSNHHNIARLNMVLSSFLCNESVTSIPRILKNIVHRRITYSSHAILCNIASAWDNVRAITM